MYACIKDLIQNMNLVIGCDVGCPYCYARNNARRFHMVENFDVPEFFPGKLRRMDNPRPQNFLLTGMSDFALWKPEWREAVFARMAANPQHQYLFLTKRPERVHFSTPLENAWFGVTVTRRAEISRIDALRENIRGGRRHVTFEPMFDDVGEVDLRGVDWIVVGTETGRRRGKSVTRPEWARSLTAQARAQNIPVFWKEDLAPIMGAEGMVQELPEAFERVLEAQRAWKK